MARPPIIQFTVPRMIAAGPFLGVSTYFAIAVLGFFSDDHKASDEIPDDRLLYTLTDEQIRQEITAQHVIIRPRRESIRLFVPRRLMPDQTAA